ncbi:RecQ family ATP-dependent DNA helicase [Lacticaseibacillus parakribbianus]|uniref:RecQ family ATP-dependent DNA helicase n=1 Tax=Lacticaseibacillus parakribbianus TaxID=2970927 RepID=UPI0021CB0A47|nr:RecQ family ATP-dependent DNA helicase [Lacticaseibacillus parakribbianus]
MRELREVLQETFGYPDFRPGQQAVVEAALAHRDVLGVLPTGSGKTLCYQLPSRLNPGLVVVVSPLLALMADQVARLQAAGDKRVVALSSRLSPQDHAWVLAHLGEYHVVFMAPETLLKPAVLAKVAALGVALFVVDEAHCISAWGPDFRPAYLKLGGAIARIRPASTMALTATAPRRVQQDIVQGLGLRDPVLAVASVDRPNVFLGVEQVADPTAKRRRLLALVAAVAGPTIVYFDSKAQAEATSAALVAAGVKAAYYHAGLNPEQRDLIQHQFMGDRMRVICATSAFGMGIDKNDVRLVVYTHVPESLEAYSQGIGRAGRDGGLAVSVVLVAPGDLARAAQFAGSLPEAGVIHTVFKHPDAYQDFDDPQVSLILAYIKAGFDEAAVTQRLAARLTERGQASAAMAAFLTTTGCHRAALVAHFDAPAVAHHALCCGPVTPAVLQQVAPSASPLPQPSAWREIFANIFRIKP